MTSFLLGLVVLELAAVAALLLTFKETFVSQTQDLRDAITELNGPCTTTGTLRSVNRQARKLHKNGQRPIAAPTVGASERS